MGNATGAFTGGPSGSGVVEARLAAPAHLIEAPPAVASSSGVRLELCRGKFTVRVMIDRGFDPGVLRDIVTALEAAG